jgi:hypothetical protein
MGTVTLETLALGIRRMLDLGNISTGTGRMH